MGWREAVERSAGRRHCVAVDEWDEWALARACLFLDMMRSPSMREIERAKLPMSLSNGYYTMARGCLSSLCLVFHSVFIRYCRERGYGEGRMRMFPLFGEPRKSVMTILSGVRGLSLRRADAVVRSPAHFQFPTRAPNEAGRRSWMHKTVILGTLGLLLLGAAPA